MNAWRADKPSAILVPDSFAAASLKRKLALENIPLLGIEILTPGRLRQRLSTGSETLIAVREELVLLLRQAAQSLPDNPFARSVLTDPQAFLRDLDTLDAAGWEGSELRFAPAAELAQAFRTTCQEAGVQTTRQADRVAIGGKAVLTHLLVTGFGPDQVEHDFLLQAAATAADEVNYIFSQPPSDQAFDFAWADAWEARLGPPEETDLAEEDAPPEPPEATQFLLHHNPLEEAAHIARQCLHWLDQHPAPRIGIVLPHRSLPLGREITLALDAAKVPYYDAGGHLAARPAGFLLLQAWSAMQETRRLPEAVAFIRALRAHRQLSGGQADKLLKHLREAFEQTMTDDLAVLFAACKEQEPVADFARAWPELPEHTGLEAFLEAARPVLERFAWPERMDFLTERLGLLASRLSGSVERRAFLGWLGVVVDIPGRTRSTHGQHPFGRVAVVTAREALSERWTHLIFAGMCGKQWQPVEPASGLLDEASIARLNHRAGYRPEGTGGQAPSHGRLLTHGERAALVIAACEHLAHSPGTSLVYSASLHDSPAATQSSPVNEPFLKAYREATGHLPDEARLRALADATAQRLGQARPRETFRGSAHFIGVHQNRRNHALPFDGHFFGFDTPPPCGLDFSFSQWENAFKHPGYTWIKQAIACDTLWRPEEGAGREMVIGTWVHDWLNPLPNSDNWVPLPTTKLWRELIRERTAGLRTRLATAYTEANRQLPDWCQEVISQAQNMADELAEAVVAAGPGDEVCGEYALPVGELELVPDVLTLRARGRIDLMARLSASAPNTGMVWLLDFKTGKRDPITDKRLSRGEGLQLALYALALRQLGYHPVHFSLLSPGKSLQQQLTAEDALGQESLWQGVADIHRTGTLGHRGAYRSDFSFSGHYPLANLPIAANVLAAKWAHTHPHLEGAAL